MSVLKLCSLFLASFCLFLILQLSTAIANTSQQSKFIDTSVRNIPENTSTEPFGSKNKIRVVADADFMSMSNRVEQTQKQNPNYDKMHMAHNKLGLNHSASI
ncbi:hypothetical protein WDU94_010542 [Cyamophila willieti]